MSEEEIPVNQSAQPMSESEIESEMQKKNLTRSPRIAPGDVDRVITGTDYYVFPNTTVTVACLTLRNGFYVCGYSACLNPANFDVELGRQVAFNDARDKIWKLEAYRLKERKRIGGIRE